jgi:IMP dehydrogenase
MADKLPMDDFFAKMVYELTFDDVTLKSGYSDTMPSEIDIKTKFSRNIPLNIPLVSAAMDTVTEYKLARKIAMLGGIGVIHKNLPIVEQAEHVSKVKYYLNGLIDNPKYVMATDTIEQILNKKAAKKYEFDTFPVLNSEMKLVGIITGNDFFFAQDYDKSTTTADKIMTKDPIALQIGASLDEAYKLMMEKKIKTIPLINETGGLLALYTLKDLRRIKEKSSIYNVDENSRLRVAAAIGPSDEDRERLDILVKKMVDVVVIDTAHSDTKSVLYMLEYAKKTYTDLDVVVGNVSEPESAERLANAGADGIKIGQGPGSICTTRVVAGIGKPQVSAIYLCAKVLRGSNVPVCADGGVQYSGDIAKAIGAGAYSVMLGSVLAGTLESPGEVILQDGRQWKSYRGMGSLGAMQDNQGSRDRYRQTNKNKLVPEGVEGLVPYKGPLNEVIFQLIGGLRAGMGYVGAANIKELHEKANFNFITTAGKIESHPHDIIITREAPNYSPENIK